MCEESREGEKVPPLNVTALNVTGPGPLYPRLLLGMHLFFPGKKVNVLEPQEEGRKLENLPAPPTQVPVAIGL